MSNGRWLSELKKVSLRGLLLRQSVDGGGLARPALAVCGIGLGSVVPGHPSGGRRASAPQRRGRAQHRTALAAQHREAARQADALRDRVARAADSAEELQLRGSARRRSAARRPGWGGASRGAVSGAGMVRVVAPVD